MNPPKKDVAENLLERGNIFVYLDPRRERVGVPECFHQQPKLVLDVGWTGGFRLRLTEDGFFAELVFATARGECFIPWTAVFALTDESGQGIVWKEDVPRELVEAQEQAAKRGRA